MSIETLTETILEEMGGINKWRRNFLGHLLRLFLSMQGHYTFLNAERYGVLGEVCYRQHFERLHDWATFNYHLIMQSTSAERINIFEPSYLSNNGRLTPGVGWYWLDYAGKAKWGLEIGAFSVVDAMNHTALHLLAAQTLKKETGKHKSLLEYYGSLVGQHAGTLLQISVFFVLDAYFSCKPYVDESCECGLHLVTRLRDDSVLYYPYIVRQHEGRGRHKKFAGRVDIRNLNEEFFCACICDEQDGTAYKSRVGVKSWKRWAKVIVMHQKDQQGNIKRVKVVIKTRYFIEPLLNRFFEAYGINSHLAKNKHAYKSLYELGKIAA